MRNLKSGLSTSKFTGHSLPRGLSTSTSICSLLLTRTSEESNKHFIYISTVQVPTAVRGEKNPPRHFSQAITFHFELSKARALI